MRKNFKQIGLYAIIALTVSCGKETLTNGKDVNSKKLTYLTDEKLATCKTIANSITTNTSSYEVLSSNKFDNLNELLLSDLFNLLKTDNTISDKLIRNIEKDGIPGCFIHNEQKLSESNVKDMLIMFAPFSDNAKVIEGVDLSGKIVTMDVTATKEYEGVILFVDQQGKFEAEKDLKQANAASNGTTKVAISNVPWQVVSSISCIDDKEPWFKGAAEVYSITMDYYIASNYNLGMSSSDITYLDFDFFDNEGINYPNVNKNYINWSHVPNNYCTVYFCERDANYNYALLAGEIALAAAAVYIGPAVLTAYSTGGITAVLAHLTTGQKFATGISVVMYNFFGGAPTYTDTDDIMDIFYSIEKPSVQNASQTVIGSANNVTMTHHLKNF